MDQFLVKPLSGKWTSLMHSCLFKKNYLSLFFKIVLIIERFWCMKQIHPPTLGDNKGTSKWQSVFVLPFPALSGVTYSPGLLVQQIEAAKATNMAFVLYPQYFVCSGKSIPVQQNSQQCDLCSTTLKVPTRMQRQCRVRKGAGGQSVVSACQQTLAGSISKAFI